MAATDSIPPGLEFGGCEEVEKPELKTSRAHCVQRIYIVSISILAYVHPTALQSLF